MRIYFILKQRKVEGALPKLLNFLGDTGKINNIQIEKKAPKFLHICFLKAIFGSVVSSRFYLCFSAAKWV